MLDVEQGLGGGGRFRHRRQPLLLPSTRALKREREGTHRAAMGRVREVQARPPLSCPPPAASAAPRRPPSPASKRGRGGEGKRYATWAPRSSPSASSRQRRQATWCGPAGGSRRCSSCHASRLRIVAARGEAAAGGQLVAPQHAAEAGALARRQIDPRQGGEQAAAIGMARVLEELGSRRDLHDRARHTSPRSGRRSGPARPGHG